VTYQQVFFAIKVPVAPPTTCNTTYFTGFWAKLNEIRKLERRIRARNTKCAQGSVVQSSRLLIVAVEVKLWSNMSPSGQTGADRSSLRPIYRAFKIIFCNSVFASRKLRYAASSRVVCWCVRCICACLLSTNPDFEDLGKSALQSTFMRNGVAQKHFDQPTRHNTTPSKLPPPF